MTYQTDDVKLKVGDRIVVTNGMGFFQERDVATVTGFRTRPNGVTVTYILFDSGVDRYLTPYELKNCFKKVDN